MASYQGYKIGVGNTFLFFYPAPPDCTRLRRAGIRKSGGIGLSLSKQIMLTMGGDILLNSKKEGWTTFTVVLNKTV